MRETERERDGCKSPQYLDGILIPEKSCFADSKCCLTLCTTGTINQHELKNTQAFSAPMHEICVDIQTLNRMALNQCPDVASVIALIGRQADSRVIGAERPKK